MGAGASSDDMSSDSKGAAAESWQRDLHGDMEDFQKLNINVVVPAHKEAGMYHATVKPTIQTLVVSDKNASKKARLLHKATLSLPRVLDASGKSYLLAHSRHEVLLDFGSVLSELEKPKRDWVFMITYQMEQAYDLFDRLRLDIKPTTKSPFMLRVFVSGYTKKNKKPDDELFVKPTYIKEPDAGKGEAKKSFKDSGLIPTSFLSILEDKDNKKTPYFMMDPDKKASFHVCSADALADLIKRGGEKDEPSEEEEAVDSDLEMPKKTPKKKQKTKKKKHAAPKKKKSKETEEEQQQAPLVEEEEQAASGTEKEDDETAQASDSN
jgi:hypothetical protein